MENVELDTEERELLTSFEADEWRSLEDMKAELLRYRGIAAATSRKDRRVNIRLSSHDLVGIQRKALEEGIPYQTLIASILHKFVSGRLIERP
jgi:predicted DNA binding CopG/RHH family protein